MPSRWPRVSCRWKRPVPSDHRRQCEELGVPLPAQQTTTRDGPGILFDVLSCRNTRERARKQRQLLADGVDPIEARKEGRTAALLEQAKALTFDACAEQYIEAHRAGWRNEKYGDRWANTLKVYASPVFDSLPVQAVDTALVMRAL